MFFLSSSRLKVIPPISRWNLSSVASSSSSSRPFGGELNPEMWQQRGPTYGRNGPFSKYISFYRNRQEASVGAETPSAKHATPRSVAASAQPRAAPCPLASGRFGRELEENWKRIGRICPVMPGDYIHGGGNRGGHVWGGHVWGGHVWGGHAWGGSRGGDHVGGITRGDRNQGLFACSSGSASRSHAAC